MASHCGHLPVELWRAPGELGLEHGEMTVPNSAGKLAETQELEVNGLTGGDCEDLFLLVEHDAGGKARKDGEPLPLDLDTLEHRSIGFFFIPLETLEYCEEWSDRAPIVLRCGHMRSVSIEAAGEDSEQEN